MRLTLKAHTLAYYLNLRLTLSLNKYGTIDKFIAKKYNILVDKFDELEEKNELDEKILERFNIFSKNYQDIDAQKNTKNDIMLMIYNNKNKINMK